MKSTSTLRPKSAVKGRRQNPGQIAKNIGERSEPPMIHRSARFARQYFCCLTSFFAYGWLKWLQRPYKKRTLSYVVLWSALYVLYKMNDDLLPEMNGKLPQVPPYHVWQLWRITTMGGGGGQILTLWICITVNCNVFRQCWVKKSLNKRSNVTSTRTSGLEHFLFWNGILRWGIGNLA